MTTDGSVLGPLDSALDRLRDREQLGLTAAVGIGFAVVLHHWFGLVVAGGLVGLAARTTKRAVLVGLAFGGVVVVTFLAWLYVRGLGPAYLGMGQLTLLNVGLTLGLPTLAAVGVRGLT